MAKRTFRKEESWIEEMREKEMEDIYKNQKREKKGRILRWEREGGKRERERERERRKRRIVKGSIINVCVYIYIYVWMDGYRPVGWGCGICWLHLCREVKLLPMSVLAMKLNCLIVRLQFWSFKESEVTFHSHYSQVHSWPEWLYLLGSYLWFK